MLPRHLQKRKTKHGDTIVNSIQTLPLPIKNTLSNTHNNPRPQFYCFETNLSTSYRADQDAVFVGIIYSYDRTISYPTDSVDFQVIKSRICINLSTDDLNTP